MAMRSSLFRRATVLVTLLGCCGCAIPSHVHSPENAAAAKEARDVMVEYGKGSPKMYAAMLANLERFKVEEEYLLAELAANVSQSLATSLPSMPWSGVKTRVDTALGEVRKLRDDFPATLAAAAAAPGAADAKTLKERLDAARAAVKAAKKNVTDWNASVAVLQESLRHLIVSGSARSGAASLRSVGDAIAAVKDTPVEYFDADGKKVTESIGDVLRQRIPTSLTALRSADGRKSLVDALPDAPGLELVIASLGLELAELEQRRAEAHLADVAALTELLEDASAQLEIAEALLRPTAEWFAGTTMGRPRPGENVFVDVRGARAQARDHQSDPAMVLAGINQISGYLYDLRTVAVGESIVTRVSHTTAVAIARLEHARSIRASSFNDVQYQAVIRSGLDGLAAYHAGGLKAEDVANIIRFAQALGVGVIAGKVN
jgi:hypothetical protein